MKKYQSYIMLFIFFAALIPSAAIPTPAKAQGLTEVEIQPDGNSGYDTYISSANATTNYATDAALLIGETATDEIGRALITWDLSGLPFDADIENATLSLWVSEDLATSAGTLQVFPVLPPWVELEATWNAFATGGAWQTAGASGAADIGADPIGEYELTADLVSGTQSDIVLDPGTVGDVLRGNYVGFLLKTELETTDSYKFYSSDEATETTKRPKLTLEYDPSPIITDPGWYCVDGTVSCAPFLNTVDTYSPFYHQTLEEDAPNAFGGTWNQEGPYTALAAKINCEPYPKCRNDYPIYYYLKFTYEWTSYSQSNIAATTTLKVTGAGGDSVVDKYDMRCIPYNTSANHGICKGFMSGVIQPEDIPDEGNGSFDFYIKTHITFFAGYPVSSGVLWDWYLSRQEPPATCSDTYAVPVIDSYNIDPTIELPEGMVGDETPVDEQGYPTTIGGIYMIRMEGGPWYEYPIIDNPPDRYDTAISFDGTTYITIQELVNGDPNVLCVDMDPENPYYSTIYFSAPSEAVYIRVSDYYEGLTPSFEDNTDGDHEMSYSIGEAFLADAACPQFSYSAEDMVADIEVPSTDDGVPVNEESSVFTSGEWYGIKVVNGTTWHEDAPTTERIDMEFKFTLWLNEELIVVDWTDLADGSDLVSCTSTDGTMVFIQAPAQDEMVLHLHVNDQDDPQNFTDNTGTLDVRVYHVTYQFTPTGCAEGFALDDLVASGEVRGDQVNGMPFANNLLSPGLTTSYDLIPGALYALQTRGGPWWLRETASSSYGDYEPGIDYFDIQLKSVHPSASSIWYDPPDWPLTECSTETDALGHIRIYFQVPDNNGGDLNQGGAEYYVRVAGAGLLGVGSIGWDLYQAVEAEQTGEGNPWTTCLEQYVFSSSVALNDNAWIPVKEVEGTTIVQYGSTGGGASVLEAGKDYWLETSNGPWLDGVDPLNKYGAQISSDGGENWYSLSDHADVYCAELDPLGSYERAFFEVEVGQVWKIRVADTETEIFTDNTGSLAYTLHGVNPHGFPITTDEITDSNFEVCAPILIRPALMVGAIPSPHTEYLFLYVPSLPSSWDTSDWVAYLGDWFESIGVYIGDLFDVFIIHLGDLVEWSGGAIQGFGRYMGDWTTWINRSFISYFAWCPRHVNILLVAIHRLEEKEPLATVRELDSAADTTIAEVKSYEWGGGGEGGGLGDGYEDTSIFSYGEGGGTGADGSAVDAVVEKILPTNGTPYDVWDGGDVVDFSSSEGLPDFYYTCGTAFSNYLPSRLRDGTCFVSAYWKETGAAWWVQLSLDIFTVFMLLGMIKSAAQSLIYMMTGVRPWTRDGAVKIITEVASGQNVVQSPENWRRSR